MAHGLPLFATEAITASLIPLFKGRLDLVENAVRVLMKPTQTCVIFGERGVGKTSLAWQIMAALSGTHAEYKELAKRYRIKPGQFTCVPVKGMTAPTGVNDLLIRAIAPSQDTLSLQGQVPELYKSQELLNYVKQTYDINLLSMNDMLLFGKDNEYKELVQSLFDDVMGFARKNDLVQNVIFFVDEADDIPNKTGLGKIVKNTKFSKFVFIGITDTIEELITDHLSAGRKLIAGDIEVKPLSAPDIRAIYRDAVGRGGGRLGFSEGFLDKVVKHSAGFPWIAQHVGDQVTDDIDLLDDQVHVVPPARFDEVFPALRRLYVSKRGSPINYEVVKASRVAQRCCRYLLSASGPRALEEAHISMGGSVDVINGVLNELILAGILRRRADGKYRFEDPIIRSFVSEELEQK